MPIDPTKPLDSVNAVKADLRTNLQAAKDGIETADSVLAGTATTVSGTTFGNHTFVRIRCTGGATATVTLANNVPAGCALELVQYGAGLVTAIPGAGATLVKPAAASTSTAAQYDAMIFEVDTNTGTNAAWRLVTRS
jgi:hypothetical protein